MLASLENNLRVPQTVNSRSRYMPERHKTYIHTKTYTQIFKAAFLSLSKSESNLVVH
jgi:hypothetical protein